MLIEKKDAHSKYYYSSEFDRLFDFGQSIKIEQVYVTTKDLKFYHKEPNRIQKHKKRDQE